MAKKRLGESLHKAKKAKNDEFYTQRTDIDKELQYYEHHFEGKTVICNCDDPRISEFVRYFVLKFHTLKLKKLIAVCYKNQNPDMFSQGTSEKAVYIEYSGEPVCRTEQDFDKIPTQELAGDGDFRKKESIELLKQADIVCTNPPFSLFREYVKQLMKYEKKFLIIGNLNAITYKEIFPLIRDNKMWLGGTPSFSAFKVPKYYEEKSNRFWIDESGQKWRSLGNICWFTNLDNPKRNQEIILCEVYSPEKFPKYDNYDAIEVDRVDNIPMDYDGIMGVPVTFLNKYNPEQFEIIGMGEDNGKGYSGGVWLGGSKSCLLNSKAKFKRIFIRKNRLL